MLNRQNQPDVASDGVVILAIGAIAAGIIGVAAQNAIDIPNTDETGNLREQRNLTKAAWLCLAGTGVVSLVAEAAHSAKAGKSASAEAGAVHER